MKRIGVLVIFLTASIPCTAAGAQDVTQTAPLQRGQGGQRGVQGNDPLAFLQLLAQARGGGQRGPAPAPDQKRRVVRDESTVPFILQPGIAWWVDSRLVQQLGLTEDQLRRIETTFEAFRLNLETTLEQLDREEAQLSRLLDADPLDRSAVSTQVDRAIQARGNMERTNAAMMLEMRGHLTPEQWVQLQRSQSFRTVRLVLNPSGEPGGPSAPLSAAQSTTEPQTRIGADIAQKNLVSTVNPVYPSLARAARVQGNVVLEISVSKEGAVADIKTVSGHPLLNEAAMDAVKQWRYKPQLLNGQPISFITTVTVPFANP